MLATRDRHTARTDECYLPFKFPALLRQFCWWSDCSRRRQSSMLLLSHASATKRSGTRSKQLGTHSSFLTFTHSGTPTPFLNLIFVKSTRYGSNVMSNIQLCCCSLWRHSSRLPLQESSDTMKTILFERRSQAHFGASADQFLTKINGRKGSIS